MKEELIKLKFKKSVLILFLLSGFLCFSQDNTRFSETIIEEDLKKHMLVLASDSLEGRETGKPGQKMAADYIKSYFKTIGIPPYKGKKILSKI